MQNLTTQKVCLALITLGFFIVAPWLTSQTIVGNTTPLLGLLGVFFVFGFIFVIRDRCWMIIPFTLPIEGNLNFLPLNFSIQELSIIGVFVYLLYRMIFGLSVVWKLGPASIWVPLALLLSIIVYHWVESRDIGIKLLGGTGWGGRKYFTVYARGLRNASSLIIPRNQVVRSPKDPLSLLFRLLCRYCPREQFQPLHPQLPPISSESIVELTFTYMAPFCRVTLVRNQVLRVFPS